MKKDIKEITGLELEILRIVNKYGYGKLNATKNSNGEFEYDGVIEMDLKKHDSMVKELTTIIQTERKEAEEDGRNKLACQILEGVTTAQEVFLNMIKDILKESEK